MTLKCQLLSKRFEIVFNLFLDVYSTTEVVYSRTVFTMPACDNQVNLSTPVQMGKTIDATC